MPSPSAASGPSASSAEPPRRSGYQRREPEHTLLHRVVREHWKTFLVEVAARTGGSTLPGHVTAEFERYLRCGILAHGFARVRCTSCGDELLVAFSCKTRGFCPSCATRRMQGTATHLIGHVIPRVPVREWVLSLPRWARFLLARDPALITGRCRSSSRRSLRKASEDDARPLDALGYAQAESVTGLGLQRGAVRQPKKHAALLNGFSLHNGVHLHANDREGLAHLCGYGARPALSQERLSLQDDGSLLLRFKRQLSDGRTGLRLAPTELLRRLAARWSRRCGERLGAVRAQGLNSAGAGVVVAL